LHFIRPKDSHRLKKLFSDAELLQVKPSTHISKSQAQDIGQVYIQGEKDVMITYAKCCSPVLPKPIIGYITRGRGITVHVASCHCVKNLALDRLVHASWSAVNLDTKYQVQLIVEAEDRVGLLRDLLQELARYNINIVHLNIHPRNQENHIRDEILIEVEGVDQITAAIDAIVLIPGVLKAYQMAFES
jgi:GTP pyrophosphokinase